MQLTQGAITRKDGRVRMAFEIEFDETCRPGDLHAEESQLQQLLNTVAVSAVGQLLSRYDTHGEPLQINAQTYTSKGSFPQTYQCYGGPVEVKREVYQGSDGGRTYCPMEDRARIVSGTTPHFAAIVTGKYSAQSGRAVRTDLQRTMQRSVSVDFIQTLAGEVGKTVTAKERYPAYQIQTPADKIHAVVMAADSTCVPIVGEEFKHVPVGCFCLMGAEGECLEKFYAVNSPEDRKVNFWQRMDVEARRLAQHCGPDVPWFGVCDGAPELQEKLEIYCDVVTLDFYHLSEYVGEAAEGAQPTPEAREKWIGKVLHDLKHSEGAAGRLLASLKRRKAKASSPEAAAVLDKAIGYVERNQERMHYAAVRAEKMPIGSGVIEAACKHVVKQRVSISGARWKRKELQHVLSLRCLYLGSNRWEQFWRQCADFGY